MQKYEQKEIYTRIDNFVLQTLTFIKIFPKDLITIEICRQLIRSVTSVGANAREAQASQSKKEFVHCFSISKKECKESWYWLTLLSKLNIKVEKKLNPLIDEANQLTAIISSIVKSSRLRI